MSNPQNPGHAVAAPSPVPTVSNVHSAPASASSSTPQDAEAARLRENIAQTRAEMEGTIGELHDKLNPAVLKGQAMEQLQDMKESLLADFHHAKVTLEAELKESLKAEVTAVITQAKTEARVAIAEATADVKQGISDASTALRAATIGKVEHMIQDARDTVSETGNTFVETVKQNPIPAVLTGVGIAWLIMNARTTAATRRHRGSAQGRVGEFQPGGYRQRSGAPMGMDRAGGASHAASDALHTIAGKVSGAATSVGHTVSDAAHSVEHAVDAAIQKVGDGAQRAQASIGQATHAAGESIGHFAHDASDTLAHAAHDAELQARRMERQIEAYYFDNPLVVGAVVVALGTVVGLAIPITAQEDRWMGAASDGVTNQARALAQQGLKQVDGAAKQVAGEVAKALHPASARTGGMSDGRAHGA